MDGKPHIVFPGLQHNQHDPVKKALPVSWQALFSEWSRVTDRAQVPLEVPIGAAINMLIVCLRNGYDNRRQVEARYDEIAAKMKALLMEHYDPVTGRRRNIFPFAQGIHPAHHDDRDDFQKAAAGS